MLKNCIVCSVIVTEENCYKSDFIRGGVICKNCRKNKRKAIPKFKNKIYSKIKNLKMRRDIFNNYGNECECCGCDMWSVLSLDHINGNGYIERKENKMNGAGLQFYRKLKRENYPKENIRTLCMNCNCSFGFHKVCIHKKNETNETCLICGVKNFDTFPFFKENKTLICKLCLYNFKKPTINFDKWCINTKAVYGLRLNLLNSFENRFCYNCGNDNMLYLTLDHINKDGAEERKTKSSCDIYRNIVNGKADVSKYRLLCYNCNCILSFFGDFPQNLFNNIDDYIEEIKICNNYKDYKIVKGCVQTNNN